jgi:hypothetical protein
MNTPSPITSPARTALAAAAVLAVACSITSSQASPPLDLGINTPLRPSTGYLNDYLRADDPYMAAWNLGVQYRARYEIKENGGATGAGSGTDFSAKPGVANDNAYLLQKTLIRVGYTAKWWEAFVQGRNSSSTSDKRPSTGALPGSGAGPESDGPIDLHQAYIGIGNHKEFPFSVKVGRQELSYGEERLVGAFAWNNIGRVFDAAKLRWQNSWFSGDFFTSRIVLPDDNNFNTPNDYDYFSGAYLTSKKIPTMQTEFYFFARNASPQATAPGPRSPFTVGTARDIYTVGARLVTATNDWGNINFFVDGAYQFGHYNDPAIAAVGARGLEQKAYMVVANGSYTWQEAAFTPKLGLEYCFGSGDSNPTDGKHETFENLFPTNHKFYGFADFASLQNLHDVRLYSSVKPLSRLTLLAEAHLFWLADTHDNFYNVGGARRGGLAATPGTGYGINPGYSSDLGTETDLIATWALSPYASIEVGYCHFFRGNYVKDSLSVIGSKDADYVYLQTQLSF